MITFLGYTKNDIIRSDFPNFFDFRRNFEPSPKLLLTLGLNFLKLIIRIN